MNNKQIHKENTGIFNSLLLFINTITMSVLVFIINSISLVIKYLFNLLYKILLETLLSISHTDTKNPDKSGQITYKRISI